MNEGIYVFIAEIKSTVREQGSSRITMLLHYFPKENAHNKMLRKSKTFSPLLSHSYCTVGIISNNVLEWYLFDLKKNSQKIQTLSQGEIFSEWKNVYPARKLFHFSG